MSSAILNGNGNGKNCIIRQATFELAIKMLFEWEFLRIMIIYAPYKYGYV